MRAKRSFAILLLALAAVAELGAQGTGSGACPRPLGLTRPVREISVRPTADKQGPEVAGVTAESGVIRVDTKLVITEFEVRDKKGRPVLGLTAPDFRIEEDGVEQNIEIFSFGRGSARIGRSIVLIIDYSQSQAPYIETSVEAAKVLVNMLEPSDRMAVVTDDVELLIGFTSDKSELKVRLDKLKARNRERQFGKSLQMTALYASISELFTAGDKRPIVILQTDGDEFAQLAVWRGRWLRGECEGMLSNFIELEKTLETAGTTVYSVIPGITPDLTTDKPGPETERLDLEESVRREAKQRMTAIDGPMKQFAVRNWAKGRLRDAAAVERLSVRSGGMSQFLDRPENAGAVYRRILDEMNNRYLLGYYPKNQAPDGQARSIKVSLRSASGLRVNGKNSYTPR